MGSPAALGYLPKPPDLRRRSTHVLSPRPTNSPSIEDDPSTTELLYTRLPRRRRPTDPTVVPYERPPIQMTYVKPVWAINTAAPNDALVCTNTGGYDVELPNPRQPYSVVGSASGRVWVFAPNKSELRKVLVYDPVNDVPPSPPFQSPPSPLIKRPPSLALHKERQIRRRWPTMHRSTASPASDCTPLGRIMPHRKFYYLGQVSNGRRHGWGRLFDDQHPIMEGTWRHGRFDGWFIAYHEYYVELGFQCPFYRVGTVVVGDASATLVPFAQDKESPRCPPIQSADLTDSALSFITLRTGSSPAETRRKSTDHRRKSETRRCCWDDDDDRKNKHKRLSPSFDSRKQSRTSDDMIVLTNPFLGSISNIPPSPDTKPTSSVSSFTRYRPSFNLPQDLTKSGMLSAPQSSKAASVKEGVSWRVDSIESSRYKPRLSFSLGDGLSSRKSMLIDERLPSSASQHLRSETISTLGMDSNALFNGAGDGTMPRIRRAGSFPGCNKTCWSRVDDLLDLTSPKPKEEPLRREAHFCLHQRAHGDTIRGCDLLRWTCDQLCQFLVGIGAYSAVAPFRAHNITGFKVASLDLEVLVDSMKIDIYCARFVLAALRHLWNNLDWSDPLMRPEWLRAHPQIVPLANIQLEGCEFKRRLGAGGHAVVWKGRCNEVPMAFKVFVHRRHRNLNLAAILQKLNAKGRASAEPGGLLRIPSPINFLPRFQGRSVSADATDASFNPKTSRSEAPRRSSSPAPSLLYKFKERECCSEHEARPKQRYDDASDRPSNGRLDSSGPKHSDASFFWQRSPTAACKPGFDFTGSVRTFARWVYRSFHSARSEPRPEVILPSIKVASATSEHTPRVVHEISRDETSAAHDPTSLCPGVGSVISNDHSTTRGAPAKKSSSHKLRDFELYVMQALPPHPNVVSVLGVCELSSIFPALVLEYCDGGALSTHVVADSPAYLSGRYERPQIIRVFHELADGLAHLHDSGFYHRDIKPSNFLIDEYGKAKISDIGVAKSRLLNNPSPYFLTAFGNAFYAAPEVLRGEGFWPQSDVYSFGVSFWEALTGRLVHEGLSRSEVIARVATGRAVIKPPSNLPSNLRSLLEEMVHFNWLERPDFKAVAARFKLIEEANQENLLSSVQCFMGL
eukprot:Blabericola_migrator_1__12892@NODE_843_length_6287_cov_71_362219_g595_i0_p1_GENE_NODE_843_length_6287_cov_71_362219_g595_i0NODE_843_length_6287_cov_71_362219_g595_i0_p1_ORF_typecomplete_len1133_score117_77Pkinase_Tyr/PF07714_17/15Pkinase_Tyr/PF07714_17/5_4e45Pkinase/PF00069_25/15Pkinase/PF00069_25/4_5e43Kinaselike/PF14531_6/1_7e09Kdo/PF06293_14/3_5e08FTA2/PF13095_6/0_0078FTA2/PF13095_6/0_72WaaY/PF06176_11/1_1e05Pkinase_fungal/PF17667_1/2_6e05PIP49_C/PF12260_8/0_00088APH/PF01636_23/0_0029SAM_2/PF